LASVCIVEIQSRLAEKRLGALLLERQKVPLHRADAGFGDIAVLHLEGIRVVPHELGHGPQILEVQEQQAVVVGHLED
jgi:hypothetical protein